VPQAQKAKREEKTEPKIRKIHRLTARTRRLSLQPNSTCTCVEPQHEVRKCAISYDVAGRGPMLLRVCWQRQVVVATVVISLEKRQPRKLPGSDKESQCTRQWPNTSHHAENHYLTSLHSTGGLLARLLKQSPNTSVVQEGRIMTTV